MILFVRNCMATNVLTLKNIYKTFPFTDVLHGVDLSVRAGESIALTGESGSGKSTLLHIAGLLESASSGEVIINGRDTNLLNDEQKTQIRRKSIGFVYQFHNLLPEFSSLENVMIPLIINGVSKKEAKEKAGELLAAVGLEHRLEQFPKKLSGGEQQRVSIARALVISPDIIIADEPTGNLDNRTADEVFNLFLRMIENNNMSLLMATHNLELASRLQTQVSLKNGKIVI